MIDVENQTVNVGDITEPIESWQVWWVSEKGTYPTLAEVKDHEIKLPVVVACGKTVFDIFREPYYER